MTIWSCESRTQSWLLVAALPLFLWGGAVRAQDVTLGIAPQGAAEKVSLSWPQGKTEGEVSLFLSGADGAAAPGIGLAAYLTEAEAGTAEVLDAATGQPKTTFDVAAGSPLRVVLRVKDVAPHAVPSGWIALTQGGKTRLHPLEIVRPAPPTLAVLEADADGKIALPLAGGRLRRTLQVQNPSITASASPRAALGPLARDDGRPLRDARLDCPTCMKKDLKLEPGDLLDLELTGSGFEEGVYRSRLVLAQPGLAAQIFDLELTRAAPLAHLDVGEAVTVAATRSPVCALWSYPYVECPLRSLARVELTVSETGGVSTDIAPPRLAELRRVDGDDVEWGIGGARLRLYRRDAIGRLRAITGKRAKARLPAHGSRAYVLDVGDLGPGAYSGEIRVGGGGSSEVTKELTLKIKDHALLPFLVILLGVLGSWYLHSWSRGGRQRALVALQISRERTLIEGRNSPPDSVWSHLLAQLNVLAEDNRLKEAKISDRLAEIRQRRSLYLDLLAIEHRITSDLSDFPDEPPEVAVKKRDFERKLERYAAAVRRALVSGPGKGLDDSAETGAPKNLQALDDLFKEIRKAAIRAPAEAMQANLGRWAEEEIPSRIEERARSLTGTIGKILSELEAGEDAAKLASRLNEARAAYVEILRDVLSHRHDLLKEKLQALAPQPDGKEVYEEAGKALDAAGTKLAASRADSLTVDEQLRHLEEARWQLLGALIHHLDLLAGDTGRPAGLPSGLWSKRLADIRRRITKAEDHWQQRKKAAEALYQEARGAYLKARAALFAEEVAPLGELWKEAAKELAKLEEAAERKAFEDAFVKTAMERLAELQATILSASNSDDVEASFHEARKKLYQGRLDELEKIHGRFADRLDEAKKQISNDEDWKAVEDGLDKLKTTLESARAVLGEAADTSSKLDVSQDLDQKAQAMTGELIAAWRKARSGGQKKMGLLDAIEKILSSPSVSAGGAEEPGAALAGGGDVTAPNAEAAPARSTRSPREWLEHIERRDFLISVIVFVAAAISGLMALWANDPTFGSAVNYLTAFLWGFGLHEASNGFLEIASGAGVLPKEEE